MMPVEFRGGICFACRISPLFYHISKQSSHVCSRISQRFHTSVDDDDIRNFAKLSSEWAKEDGWFRALHSMNRLRLPLIVNTLGRKMEPGKFVKNPLSGLHIADIGCGGGTLTFSLARLGARVTAIDASEVVVALVKEAENCFRHENRGSGEATFHCSSVEDFAENCFEMFNAVVASEILEHVTDVELFVKSCVRLVRRNGALFFTTINKTVASRVFGIWMAERVMGIVPPDIHNWSKFISPESLQLILEENGCSVQLKHGISYNPLTNRWSWSRFTPINYAIIATKN